MSQEKSRQLNGFYLGDGVYVKHDMITGLHLYTSNGLEVTNEIFLDNYVFEMLMKYVNGLDNVRN